MTHFFRFLGPDSLPRTGWLVALLMAVSLPVNGEIPLEASDQQAGDGFGYSVAISGDTAVVGAVGEDGGGSDAGAVYVYPRNQGGAAAVQSRLMTVAASQSET